MTKPSLSEFLFLVKSRTVLGCLLAKFAIKDKQNKISFVDQIAPSTICLAMRFMKEAINLEGKEGVRSERSNSLKKRVLVSVSMLNTDFSKIASPSCTFY